MFGRRSTIANVPTTNFMHYLSMEASAVPQFLGFQHSYTVGLLDFDRHYSIPISPGQSGSYIKAFVTNKLEFVIYRNKRLIRYSRDSSRCRITTAVFPAPYQPCIRCGEQKIDKSYKKLERDWHGRTQGSPDAIS